MVNRPLGAPGPDHFGKSLISAPTARLSYKPGAAPQVNEKKNGTALKARFTHACFSAMASNAAITKQDHYTHCVQHQRSKIARNRSIGIHSRECTLTLRQSAVIWMPKRYG